MTQEDTLGQMLEEYNTTPEETQRRVVSARVERKGRQTVEVQAKRLEVLKVLYLPADMFCPNDWNPNRQSDHDFELLLRSMEEDGFTQPILALKELVNGKHIIVDGEHRWRAGVALGYTEVPVVLVNMTPEQARIATMRHNLARGSHDIQLEAELLRDLQKLGALDVAQDGLMMEDVELNRMLKDIAAPEALADATYSDAWVPESFTEEEAQLVREGTESTVSREHVGGDGAITAVSMTVAAIDMQRRREKLIAQAKTERDAIQVRKEILLYRVNLVFADTEGEVVKVALGHRPAEMLLAMCRERVARQSVAVIAVG